jgi:hypothetical protein
VPQEAKQDSKEARVSEADVLVVEAETVVVEGVVAAAVGDSWRWHSPEIILRWLPCEQCDDGELLLLDTVRPFFEKTVVQVFVDKYSSRVLALYGKWTGARVSVRLSDSTRLDSTRLDVENVSVSVCSTRTGAPFKSEQRQARSHQVSRSVSCNTVTRQEGGQGATGRRSV